MKHTRKLRKISKKNKKGGIIFSKGYNPIKGLQNTFRSKTQEPTIGEHVQTMAVEFKQNVQPLKDIQEKMDKIMRNIAEQKMSCINECMKKGCGDDSKSCFQIKDMIKKKPIYEWGFMCSKPLNVKTCADFIENIKNMDLYIGAIKELSKKMETYEKDLNEMKKNMDLSEIDMNDDFSSKKEVYDENNNSL